MGGGGGEEGEGEEGAFLDDLAGAGTGGEGSVDVVFVSRGLREGTVEQGDATSLLLGTRERSPSFRLVRSHLASPQGIILPPLTPPTPRGADRVDKGNFERCGRGSGPQTTHKRRLYRVPPGPLHSPSLPSHRNAASALFLLPPPGEPT